MHWRSSDDSGRIPPGDAMPTLNLRVQSSVQASTLFFLHAGSFTGCFDSTCLVCALEVVGFVVGVVVWLGDSVGCRTAPIARRRGLGVAARRLDARRRTACARASLLGRGRRTAVEQRRRGRDVVRRRLGWRLRRRRHVNRRRQVDRRRRDEHERRRSRGDDAQGRWLRCRGRGEVRGRLRKGNEGGRWLVGESRRRQAGGVGGRLRRRRRQRRVERVKERRRNRRN